jgi:ketosteroid isomerase-like protein
LGTFDLAGERQEAHVAIARGLFHAVNEGGVEALVGLTDPDVEWIPFTGMGRHLHGHAGLRAWANTLRQDGLEIQPAGYSFESVTPTDVLATGSIRVTDGRGVRERQLAWVFSFADDRLTRVEAFTTPRAALVTLEARRAA